MKTLFWTILGLSVVGCYVSSIPSRQVSALAAPSNPVPGGIPENARLFGVWDFIR